jgi:hypothetical protein
MPNFVGKRVGLKEKQRSSLYQDESERTTNLQMQRCSTLWEKSVGRKE